MSTLTSETKALEISFDSDNLWVRLTDGRQISVPLSYYPKLLKATPGQRSNYALSGGGASIHWEELDEDLSVEGIVLGIRSHR